MLTDHEQLNDVLGDLTQKFIGNLNTLYRRDYIFLKENMTIDQVIKMFLDINVSGLPVVNDDMKIIGFFSEKEILKYCLSDKYYLEPETTVNHYMVKDITTLRIDDSITKAMEIFVENSFHVIPVVDKENYYVGAITRKDIIEVASLIHDGGNVLSA